MNIKDKIKAKTKLFETQSKLNRVLISERYGISNELYSMLLSVLDAFKDGVLLRERGGRSESTSQVDDDGSIYVEIKGKDKDKNDYFFRFKIERDDGLDDDVVKITDIVILDVSFKSPGGDYLRLGEDDLEQYNKADNTNYYEYIEKHIDLDFDGETEKEINEDNIDIDNDSSKYSQIVFMQGEEANEVLDIINERGEDEAIEYLKQWVTGDEKVIDGVPETNLGEYEHFKDNYRMFWNSHIGYVGLDYIY